jgi:threonine dehydratase
VRPDVTLADIRAADVLVRQVARRTPLLPAHWVEPLVGGPVLLKAENLQRAGSFKLRGAYVRLSRLTPAEREAGVVAASAGNHAQGVALAAAELGIAATVFMPRTASLPKVVATRAYGADVHLVGESVEDALAAAARFVDDAGATLIHPFDHVDIVAGQGSVGLEIIEQLPEVATVLVPAGGGGLLAGVATAIKGMRPQVRVVGVQAANCATLTESLARGVPVPARTGLVTMADGIAVSVPGAVPVAVAAPLVDDVVTVTEEQISDGLLKTLERAKLLAEPAGVVGVSALLADPTAYEPPVVIVLSGGNVDPVLLNRIVRHGLAVAGRHVALTVRLPDQPGALAGYLGALADTEVNVLDVSHFRSDPRLAVGEVEIMVLLETRGPDHRDAVIAALRTAGYDISLD